MGLNSNRDNNNFQFKHSGQPPELGINLGDYGLLQTYFDSRAIDNLSDINNIKDALRSQAQGDDGAINIGRHNDDTYGDNIAEAINEIISRGSGAIPADGSISEVKIASDAVSTNKIVDLAISTQKIADAAITADKLDSDSVTLDKLADGVLTSVVYSPTLASGIDEGKVVLFDSDSSQWEINQRGNGIVDKDLNVVLSGIARFTSGIIMLGYNNYAQVDGSIDAVITDYKIGFAISNTEMIINIQGDTGRDNEYTIDLVFLAATSGASTKAKIKIEIDPDSDGAMLRRKTSAFEAGDDETTGILVADITDDTNYKDTKWYHDSGLANDNVYFYKAFPYKNGIYNNVIGVNEISAIAGGLKAEYIYDTETISGSTMQDQANSYDATNTNVTYQDAGNTYDGDEGIYNGSTSKSALPGTLLTLGELNQDWSFSCVMRADVLARMALISFSENADFRFTLESGGNLQINNPSTLSTTGFTAATGTRYHVVLVRDKSAGFIIYVNGVLKGSNTDTGNLVSYGYPPSYIGAHKQFDQLYEWDGNLNLCRLYDRVLSLEEIQVLYNGGDFL